MTVKASRVGLPDFDQGTWDRAVRFVGHRVRDNHTLTDGLFALLSGVLRQVHIDLLDGIVPEDRPRQPTRYVSTGTSGCVVAFG